MIYCFDAFSELSPNWSESVLPFLPEERRKKALGLGQERDRICSVVAYLLLSYGLRQEYGITLPPELEYEKTGKPILLQHPNIYFSLSHCRKCVACAIAEEPVGLDVQEIRSVSERLIKRVCNQSEQEQIQLSDSPQETFASIWSVKESLGKLIGCGIGTNLQELTAPNRLPLYDITTKRWRDVFLTISFYR